MEGKTDHLPWEALRNTEGGIPWSALDEFAAAVAADNSLIKELIELYEETWESGGVQERYEEYYVPAIFALTAPQLSEQTRREIGVFLLDKLAEAGDEGADISMEILTAACGSMGSVILPAVLEAIENEPDTKGAWFWLWGLTELALETDDSEVRDSVIRACLDLLERADRGEVDRFDATYAAWTLAKLKYTDCRNLLKRLKNKSRDSFCYGDYADALDLLDGRLDYTPPSELWEMPVEEWLEGRWRMARDWYRGEAHAGADDEYDAGFRHIDEVVESFLKSSEAEELSEEVFEEAGHIINWVLEQAWDYFDCTPEELDEVVLGEVLLEILPRKLTAERDLFEKVGPVTDAFLRWAEVQGVLTDTEDLTEAVRGWADTIVDNGMDPEYWGMAKSFMM
ncbi:MAG: hypothetical protein ACYS8Z_15560, partial [Planctomycetota bacterium]